MNHILKHRRSFVSIRQRLAIALLAFIIALAGHPIALGQIPLLSSPSENQTQVTYWWEISKARRCGKLWCSEVAFPYFPYGRLFDSFIIAIEPKLEQDLTQVTAEIEERALTVEETMWAIFKQTAKARRSIQSELFSTPPGRFYLNWKYWLPNKDKGRHPLTPKVEVGIKNQQTVIYVPSQPDLGLYQQTIVTVNRSDALYNGKSIPELAEQWQDFIRLSFSEALWGVEFDLRYPWARVIFLALIILAILVPIFGLSWVRQLLRASDRNLRRQLRLLEDSATSEKIAAVSTNLPSVFSEKSKVVEVEQSETFNNVSASVNINPEPADISSSAEASSQTTITRKLCNLSGLLGKVQKLISNKVKNKLQNLPQISLQRQNWLKQLHNLMQFLLRMLFWTRIFILLWGVALIFAIYPYTRKLCLFFLGQAIALPIIWMLVTVADTLASFVIDYYLHQWAKEAQVDDLTSTRYALRVSTSSPALKGASSFLCILLGIYLTFQFLEIDTTVLASAGGVALVLGFLSRNILEDMLNGALILWTDRYAIGDVIQVGELAGFVENMNLYTTQLRGAEGRLITIPNGQILTVENLTKDWSRVDFVIDIAYNADTQKAIEIIEQVAEQMRSEPQWQDTILEPATILGVDQIAHTGVTIKVWLKTQPIKQWAVGREFRLRIKQAFDEAGIAPGVPQQIWRGDQTSTDVDRH